MDWSSRLHYVTCCLYNSKGTIHRVPFFFSEWCKGISQVSLKLDPEKLHQYIQVPEILWLFSLIFEHSCVLWVIQGPRRKTSGSYMHSHGRDSGILLFNCFTLGHVNSVLCHNIVQMEPDAWCASRHHTGIDIWCHYACWTRLAGNNKNLRWLSLKICSRGAGWLVG